MRRYGPRSYLKCNREDSRGARARLDKNAFGMWRPLTPESATSVQTVVAGAKVAIEGYLREQRPNGGLAELHIPEKNQDEASRRLGVTFVEKQKVRSSMGKGGHLWQAIERGRLLSEIELHKTRQDVALPVPIEGFMWCGGGQRKLVGVIENGAARQELVREAEVIEQLLADAGGKPIQVMIPDHITIAQYGTRRDGKPLSVAQRNDIELLMQDQFREASIGEVYLGALALSHDEPWQVVAAK